MLPFRLFFFSEALAYFSTTIQNHSLQHGSVVQFLNSRRKKRKYFNIKTVAPGPINTKCLIYETDNKELCFNI